MKTKTQLPRKNRKSKGTGAEDLPPIPNKRYFTIGETANLCGVRPHVLRYWEQEFAQLKPVKRRGNRRYYQSDDVLLIRKIKSLLYECGFTIEGARAQLVSDATASTKIVTVDATVKKVIADLEEVLQKLKAREIL